MNEKRLLGVIVCMLLILSTPLFAGVVAEKEKEEEKTDIIGITWLRGWIFNPKTILGMVYARAFRLHYIEITGRETHMGIVRVRDIVFRDGLFLRWIELGPLGTMAWVMGFTYGGIQIEN